MFQKDDFHQAQHTLAKIFQAFPVNSIMALVAQLGNDSDGKKIIYSPRYPVS